MELLSGYLKIASSSFAVYLFIIVAIRLFGKKELAQLSIIDLVFILLISNAVQNAMVGSDSSLAGGLVAASTLFVANYLLKYLLYRFPKLGIAVQGVELMLIYKGQLNVSNMNKARITREEILEAVREHGVSEIREVDLAVLETDGNISIISNNYKNRTTKKRKGRNKVMKNQ
ncbi:MAG TPA: YetF domain-containing protein [Prolixibacteraceae bacterium]|nr:YetF domain-containing protein [Prolixibacteraceae bacterium]